MAVSSAVLFVVRSAPRYRASCVSVMHDVAAVAVHLRGCVVGLTVASRDDREPPPCRHLMAVRAGAVREDGERVLWQLVWWWCRLRMRHCWLLVCGRLPWWQDELLVPPIGLC